MSVASTWQYPADLIEYATQKGVVGYLEPLRAMTQRLFPTATQLKIYKEDDPELRDLKFVVFELHVPAGDVPDYLAARHRWDDELCQIYPYPRVFPFVFSLHTDE